MVVGDNGVLNKGTEAVDKTTYAKADEDLKLIVSGATAYWKDAEANEGLTQTYLEYFDENYATGKTLEEKGNITGATGTYTFTSNNGTIIKFNLSDTGKITIITDENTGNTGNTEGNDTEEDDGKVAIEPNYIKNYKVDLNGDGDYTNDWRMFYIATAEDETNYGIKEGTMYIIAADYMKNSLVKIAETDDDGNTTATWTGMSTSESYVVYWNSVPTAQYDSINLNSDYTSTGGFLSLWGLAKTSNGYGKKYSSYNNGIYVSTLLNTDNWAHLVDTTCDDSLINEGDTKSNFGEYAIGGPTLEMWVASYNSSNNWSKGTKDYTPLYYNVTGGTYGYRGYYIGLTEDATTYYQYVKSATSDSQSGVTKPGYGDTLYFPHQTSWNSTYGYWLAAPPAYGSAYVFMAKYSGLVGWAKRQFDYYCVRPVVSLQSGVQAEYNESTGFWTLK